MRNYAAYNAYNQVIIIFILHAFVECLKAKEMKIKLFNASIVDVGVVLLVIVDS